MGIDVLSEESLFRAVFAQLAHRQNGDSPLMRWLRTNWQALRTARDEFWTMILPATAFVATGGPDVSILLLLDSYDKIALMQAMAASTRPKSFMILRSPCSSGSSATGPSSLPAILPLRAGWW